MSSPSSPEPSKSCPRLSPTGPNSPRLANLIDEAAARGAKLTTQLSAFARGQPSRPVAVDVNAVVAETSRLLRATLGVETEVAALLADDVPLALADPGQLTAAILSLAFVARNAMPEGGKVVFRTRPFSIEPGVTDATRRQDVVVIAIHACSQNLTGTHPDRIFGDLGIAEDFVIRSGGHIRVVRQVGNGPLAELLLPEGLIQDSAIVLHEMQTMMPRAIAIGRGMIARDAAS